MKLAISILVSLFAGILTVSAQLQTRFEGEFVLTATEHQTGLMLSKDYSLVITGGTAKIKHTTDTGPREDKGTVTLTLHNGVDPATKKLSEITGVVRIEVVKSGWATDKFVTRIELPFTAPNNGKAIAATFAESTTVEMLWRDVLANGLVQDSDIMNIRMKSPYQVKVLKNPFP